jgi:hypothetical protein
MSNQNTEVKTEVVRKFTTNKINWHMFGHIVAITFHLFVYYVAFEYFLRVGETEWGGIGLIISMITLVLVAANLQRFMKEWINKTKTEATQNDTSGTKDKST